MSRIGGSESENWLVTCVRMKANELLFLIWLIRDFEDYIDTFVLLGLNLSL
jgi:hypothetical protein